jgi:hypothetical protein
MRTHGTWTEHPSGGFCYTPPPSKAPAFCYDDGGRLRAGYKGHTGDCFCRAAAIASGLDYQLIYKLIFDMASRERIGKRKRNRSHPRLGVYRPTARRIMAELGFVWTPTMQIGSGCTVHLNADELPSGYLVLSVSKHFTAMIDGVVHDTYDPSRDGYRCVYGYWRA